MKLHLRLEYLAAGALMLVTLPAEADPLLLDFGLTGQRVQEGYMAVSGPGGTTNLANPYQLTLTGRSETISISSTSNLSFRDRGDFSTANYGSSVNLFEDFLRSGTGTGTTANPGPYSTMTIAVGGLLPDTQYKLTLHLYDGSIASPGDYSYLITGTGDLISQNNNYSVGFDASAPPNGAGMTVDEQSGYTETFTASGSGTIQVTITQTGGGESSVPLNALSLTAVPEPTSALLTLSGGVLVMARRRRSS